MTTINSATAFIHEESKLYPLTLASIRAQFPNLSFGDYPSQEAMRAVGFVVVQPTEKPEGDVVNEEAPNQMQDGSWVQVWNTRAYTQEELASLLAGEASALQTNADALRDAALSSGLPVDFGGDYGVQHVQLRDTDQPKILGLKESAVRAKGQGVTSPVLSLRTRENNIVQLTPDQMIAVSFMALDAVVSILSQSWALKDAASRAATREELPALPAAFVLETQALVGDMQ